MSKSKRTYTTDVRKDWQDTIAEVLKAIDRHIIYNGLFNTNDFHMKSYYILKQYLIELKNWIHEEEKRKGENNE
tara:strand:- start:259 stop:480 length:222 start_codon:yes stop_codon:yes gene_type:complete